MIANISETAPGEDILAELEFTLLRLSRTTDTATLQQPLFELRTKWAALTASTSHTTTTSQLIAETNEVRIGLLAALVIRGCREGRDFNWAKSFFRPPAKTLGPSFPLSYHGPSTPAEWITVATERASDAVSINAARPASIGAIYVAGYAIECSLKALLKLKRKPFPTSGPLGHDLRALWECAGFRLSDLGDTNGARAFFVTDWNTNMRYEAIWNTPPPAELVTGARELAGWIQRQLRRARTR